MSSSTSYESPVPLHSSILSTSLLDPSSTATLALDTDYVWQSTANTPNVRFRSIPRSQADSLTSTRTGGIRKKHSDQRHRFTSITGNQILRHSSLESTVDCIYDNDQAIDPTCSTLQWQTPQHSPQPTSLFPDNPTVSLNSSYEVWSIPTPPGSESNLPILSTGAAHDQAPAECGAGFALDNVVTSVEMSSLGYLLPGQYTSGVPQPDSDGYNMNPNRAQSVTSAPPAYSHTASSSPSLYQGRVAPQYDDSRQLSSTPAGPAYGHDARRMAAASYGSPATSEYSFAPSNTIPPLSGLPNPLTMTNVGSPNMAMIPPHYGPSLPRQSNIYNTSYYGQQQNYPTAPAQPPMYAPPPPPLQQQPSSYAQTPFAGSDQMSRASSSDLSARSQGQRSKAQCWEHGCNGRQFSTFSNLLRHQREKSGTATKSYCPKCGAEFTRTTARNGHLLHDKCTKTRRASEER